MKLNQIVSESLADEFAAMARAKGMNPRIHGTPEEERARSQQMLAQRAADREKASADAAAADVAQLPALKDQLDTMRAEYQALGGSNWQYADREQNLTDGERKARSMESGLNQLASRIARAEKSQGVAEGSKYKCTCHPGDADPDCPVHGLEPMEVGDALDIKKDVAEGEKIGNMDADKFDDAMARLRKLAGAGPLKTVWDPTKRVYKNVPTAVQPKK